MSRFWDGEEDFIRCPKCNRFGSSYAQKHHEQTCKWTLIGLREATKEEKMKVNTILNYVPIETQFECTIDDLAGFAFGEALSDNQRWHNESDWLKAYALKQIRHTYDIPATTAVSFVKFDYMSLERPDWNGYRYYFYVDCKFQTLPFGVG